MSLDLIIACMNYIVAPATTCKAAYKGSCCRLGKCHEQQETQRMRSATIKRRALIKRIDASRERRPSAMIGCPKMVTMKGQGTQGSSRRRRAKRVAPARSISAAKMEFLRYF
jgi:hypothetical protein